MYDKKEIPKSERLRKIKQALFRAEAELPYAIRQETGMAVYQVINGIIPALLASLAFVTVFIIAGASIGTAFGSLLIGIGALPGGVIGGTLGFEAGLWILNILGLVFLIEFMRGSLWEAMTWIRRGIMRAWGPKHYSDFPDADTRRAGYEIAHGVAILIRCILEGIVIYLTTKGVAKLPELVAS